ncbi:low affinity immunoglobulin gamma Fc region receptor II-like isoform X2 [Passer montanus]|uniref:low affinity immunoglobulin gamma Fc region receptor II-like isoform X2 n=1 Tax=Passer montanus TaxID=9160 RepID=UPI0019617B89|nr:low affinity immunoglobulin gamma Fc region receptor II-like isoform X2 [Passer montanus]
MAGDSRMAGKVALLLWAQTLSLAGAQTTQLLVEPPWRPAVWWDSVTLTCQGSGTAGASTWYKDGERWRQQGHDNITVTESGTYTCDRPDTGRSPPVKVSDVAAGVAGALLFLLFVGVIVAWKRWHHVVSPCATTLQEPQVTYAELQGPHQRPCEPGDIDGNVL